MEPGHKLDALVEQHIFGTRVTWVRPKSLLSLETVETGADDPEGRPIRADLADGTRSVAELLVRPYSREIAAAWQVIERGRGVGWEYTVQDHVEFWAASIDLPDRPGRISGRGATAPHAICMATLRAVGALA